MTEQDDFESDLAELAAIEAELEPTPAAEPAPSASMITMITDQATRQTGPSRSVLLPRESVPMVSDEPSPTGRNQGSFDPPVDNVEAAMDHLAETMDLNVSRKVSEDEGPADKQILIRSTQRDHERWKLAAEREGESLSAFVRRVVNGSVTDILDCSHPAESRQVYPWSETCLKCGTRLRDGGDNSPNSAAGRRG